MSQPPQSNPPTFTGDAVYWEALGRFVEHFAMAESALFLNLGHHAKVTDDIGKALFSGTRVDGAISFIRRIVQVAPPDAETVQELDDVLAQLQAINTVRNHLVHYGTEWSNDPSRERLSSNRMVALTERHLVEHRISSEMLDDMSIDLFKIYTHLMLQVLMPGASIKERVGLEIWPGGEALLAAWRYKRPQPARQRGQDRKARPSRPQPPHPHKPAK